MIKLIENKKDLVDTINSCEGYVIYGAGLVGTCIVQYLCKEKMASKLVCIVVKSKAGNPTSILGVPVCELEELESYKDKYTFLIATMEHLHADIASDLGELGYGKVFGISNLFYSGVRAEVSDFSPDILCTLQKGIYNISNNLSLLNRKLEEMQYIIEEQNEVSCVNTVAFAEYRNAFRGKDVVIVATGPTMNNYVPIENAVHIGINSSFRREDIPLDYLFVQDGRSSFLEKKYAGMEKLKCTIFMGRVLKRSPYGFSEFPEEYRLSSNVKNYYLDHVWPNERIYTDICHHPVSGGISVVFSALHFALYTCPRRIYLVGCDVAPNGYFDGTIDKECLMNDSTVAVMVERYRMTKEFAQMHYPETEIVSINPVGLKGMFRDVYTE